MKLINETDTPKTDQIRSHLELNLGELRKNRVSFTDLSGQSQNKDMRGILAGQREGEHYYNQQTPNGEWTFTGSKGLQLTERFDNREVNFTWLYAYPEDMSELEVELWSPQKTLQPKESISLNQSLEVENVKK
jgi:hypothetical protein